MKRQVMLVTGLVLCFASGLGSPVHADWPGFLGPGGNPKTASGSLPTGFAVGDQTRNIEWQVPLPGRSVSGPVLVDGKVITTGSSGMEGRWMNVTAVDADSGEVLWHRSTRSTGRPFCHPTSANAAPTPCTDRQRVYAFFSSNDVICYDLDGHLQWFRSMTEDHPLAGNDVGMSSSPVIAGDTVIVTVECQADSFTAGLDALTGETRWEIPRPRRANWSSPRVVTGADGRAVVVIHGSQNLVAIDPTSGRQVWELDLNCSTMATAGFVQGKLFVPARGGLGIFEINNAMEPPQQIASTSRLSVRSASFVITDFGVIGLNGSVLSCCDFSGKELWKIRLRDAGQFWATPVLVGDTLYAFAMNGKCFAVKVSQENAELVGESELGSEVLGSPAATEDALYVRSVDGLWKIARTN